MSMIPKSKIAEQRQALVRKLGIAVSALMVVLVVTVFVLVVRSESAHDETKCPFSKLSERVIGTATVIEETRSCVPEAEERRWLVQRGGQKPVEFGRKRLPKERFTADRTKWSLTEDKNKQLLLNIEVDGHPFSEFREADLPKN